ncbi:MAG: alpha/beta hydrolase [Pseudomonadota bacterium]
MNLGVLFLHALPLDGSMWREQMDLLPESSWAPTLYRLGDTIEEWVAAALRMVTVDRLIVVGCSIGGSSALEVAQIAPERVAALVLIGAKAAHRPDPEGRRSALDLIENNGIDAAWRAYWAPLFSNATDPLVVETARQTVLRQPVGDIARWVDAFHRRPNREAIVVNCSCPIIVVTGEDDPVPGPVASMALAVKAFKGRCHVIPSCGHYVPVEEPLALRAILSEVIDTEQ